MSLGLGVELAERGLVATPLLRGAIRRLCAQRLSEIEQLGGLDGFLDAVCGAPVALVPEEANAQHYEVPAAFFRLELGCGWGSLSLFMARRYPNARIVAVSNSHSRRAFIESVAPPNLRVITADMNVFEPGRRFDRVVSVEMFEHLRAWSTLLGRVHGWLKDDGQLFVHVFCHRSEAYTYETEGADNWMGRYFFSGGIMPSFGLLPAVADGFELDDQWWMDGTHYQRTAAAWRRNMERRRGEVQGVLRARYGAEAGRWYHRWRMFFLACEELFGYAGGAEWGVAHYRLARGELPAGAPR